MTYYVQPGSMITDHRIFSRQFAVYGRIRALFFDQGVLALIFRNDFVIKIKTIMEASISN